MELRSRFPCLRALVLMAYWQGKRPDFGYSALRYKTRAVLLHQLHDSVVVVIEYLEEHQVETLPCLLYSSDRSPCGFWLNPHVKEYIRRRFESHLAFYINLKRVVIGPSATLTGR